MAAATFADYSQAVRNAIQASDGPALAQLLRIDAPTNRAAVQDLATSQPSFDEAWQRRLGATSPWSRILATTCECMRLMDNRRHVDAFDALTPAVDAFSSLFKDDAKGWMVRPMVILASNIQLAAEAADAELSKAGKKPDRLDPKACEHLQSLTHERLYRDPIRKDAQLAVTNQRLRIYFRINNLNQAKHLIKSTEGVLSGLLDRAPASDAVTFRFFCGRLAVLQENYTSAVADLTYALKRCHRDAREQQQAILRFLIPARLLLSPSQIPSHQLVTVFGLDEYLPLLDALRAGSIATFNTCLDENLERFVQRGVYFLVERLKTYVYRRLFKRVATLHAATAQDKERVRVPLQLFTAALQAQGEEMDLDEVECILANLIYRGLIKGYLSHSHRKIVLKPGTPDEQFPLPRDAGMRLI